jgi:hypothetical protein
MGSRRNALPAYHINAVDCVTQWEQVASCEKISEAYLLPVIEALLAGFPFRILGFHADNGSEYINHKVAIVGFEREKSLPIFPVIRVTLRFPARFLR